LHLHYTPFFVSVSDLCRYSVPVEWWA